MSHDTFFVTDWSKVPPVEYPGEVGKAIWKTTEIGGIRVRMVEYTPGYRADHWCSRGHVVLLLEGELCTELQNGNAITLTPGSSYQVKGGEMPHRSSTRTGAKLFIVD